MTNFADAYTGLNAAQKQAVDTIDGAVMVIAGPGTGKTQLLSTRAAAIVNSGDVTAANILCLTYTDAGAAEMRERLLRIMGPEGANIVVHTFHSFGTSLINQYPEHFTTIRSLVALDDLGRYRIFERLLSKLPMRHQLAVRGDTEQFIRLHAVEEAIRAFKQAGLNPEALRTMQHENIASFQLLQPLLDETFGSTLHAKRLPEIAAQIAALTPAAGSLAAILIQTMTKAVIESIKLGKTKPLGAWRDAHTVIGNGKRILKSEAQSSLLSDTIQLYEGYQQTLTNEGRYDYEDMIIWASTALETNQDLLLDIAERYQYIMVDEYQDTNGAQNKLLDTLLSANPLDVPNIMVVGDDDQAIMRFQGAEVSGMVRFAQTYQPKIIVLTDNYRSSQAVISAARQLITMSDDRLEVSLPELGLIKRLKARNEPSHTTLQHYSFASSSLQYQAITEQVRDLLDSGVPATEIAVIGRKHAELAAFVPFLTNAGITTNYDHHENILEQPLIVALLKLAQYVAVLTKNPIRAAALLPAVLSASYWQLPPLAVYQIAAQSREHKTAWLDTMLATTDKQHNAIAEWLIAAATQSQTQNFTHCLDIVIGRTALTNTTLKTSPFSIYLTPNSPEYIQLLSHLIRLRRAVLEARPTASSLSDLLEVIQEYRLSGLRLVDTNPILRGDAAGVQVMSAHSSKGREFQQVIILSAVDTIWGSKARAQNTRIRLPENLPLYPAGDADNDRLRLLYVAMTRAKSDIVLSSYTATDEGKAVPPLVYTQFDGWWQAKPQAIQKTSFVSTLETAWNPPSRPPERPLHTVLQPLLKNYRLSASALRTFLDLRYAGPQACIEQSVLKFPSAYNAHSALGSAAHKTLDSAYKAYITGTILDTDQLLTIFDATLEHSGLSTPELEPVKAHGHQFLPDFITQFRKSDFDRITASEQFATALLTNTIPISGAIDALAETGQTTTVIDYKTGKPPEAGWSTKNLSDSKKTSLHFYRQQLLFYKLLLDASPSQSTVSCAELVFVEPPEHGKPGEFVRLTIDDFSHDELQRTEALIKAVYDQISSGILPDTSNYSLDLKGIEAFETDLLAT